MGFVQAIIMGFVQTALGGSSSSKCEQLRHLREDAIFLKWKDDFDSVFEYNR